MIVKVSATVEKGCSVSANNVHFNLAKDNAITQKKWSDLTNKVFDAVEFMTVKAQCSKGTQFYLSNSNSEYPSGTANFKLKHTTNPSAPPITYWLNNYSPNATTLASMISSNIKRNVPVTDTTRLFNEANHLSYTSLDENEGWIKFAAQLEANSYYQFEAGNYADTVNLRLTY